MSEAIGKAKLLEWLGKKQYMFIGLHEYKMLKKEIESGTFDLPTDVTIKNALMQTSEYNREFPKEWSDADVKEIEEETTEHGLYISIGLKTPMKPSELSEKVDDLLCEHFNMQSWGVHTKHQIVGLVEEYDTKLADKEAEVERLIEQAEYGKDAAYWNGQSDMFERLLNQAVEALKKLLAISKQVNEQSVCMKLKFEEVIGEAEQAIQSITASSERAAATSDASEPPPSHGGS